NRLRCQDLGLKTHLDQLDQQVSELQLDMCRTSTEGPDGDSRPSSGFYEMSDGGSCSLSASCTSVCSDRLSSSLGTLLPSAPQARTSAGDCRPWSADDTTMCGGPLSVWGLQATEDGAGPSRPRPVSTGTGELGRVGAPSRRWGGCGRPLPLRLDPKYQRDLVSKGGREVYLYPSPLHAVALQSPLFALPTDTPQRDSPPQPSSQPLPGHSGPRPIRTGPLPEAGAARAYIDKLLGRRGPGRTPRGHVGEQGPPSQRAETERHPEGLTCSPRRADVGGGALRRDTGGNSLEQRGPAPCGSPLPPSSLPEEGQRPPRSCIHAGTIPGSPQLGGAPRAPQAAPTSREGTARLSTRMGPGPCVHPHSVVCSAAPMGLRMGQKPGPPTTKAARSESGSKHSAECASLFHSTITETSKDRASDHTAGRFGDQESSGSNAEGGVQDVGSRPAWPGTSHPQHLRTPGSRPPLSPVPKLCHIKASKALKKKICRFQPTALKVMTLV
ncbi:Dapper like protein 2, partial [Myotis brandtii]